MCINVSYFFSSGDLSPFQKFLIKLRGNKLLCIMAANQCQSALYAQQCQFSIVGLVTGRVMNIINISLWLNSYTILSVNS